MPRHRQIKTKPDDTQMGLKHFIISPNPEEDPQFELAGWFRGKDSYLWFGLNNICLGTLSGGKLYRLAKAIVKHYESERDRK